jgi:hypothetical protein
LPVQVQAAPVKRSDPTRADDGRERAVDHLPCGDGGVGNLSGRCSGSGTVGQRSCDLSTGFAFQWHGSSTDQ